jgi:S-formylglutathione hydrolase FrmB
MKYVLLALLVGCSHDKPAPAPAPAPVTTHGKITKERFHSNALGVDKDYVLYLPADYESGKKFPVFYYLHGLTGKETDWWHGGKIDEAADQLGLEAILVMPDGDDGFYSDAVTPVDYDACMKDGTGLFLPAYQPKDKTCVKNRAYETYIVKDLVGEIDGKYHTLATREARAIAGLSMGGFGALELAMRHQDLFSAAASHSGVDALLYAGPHPYVAGKAEIATDVSQWGNAASIAEIGKWVRGIFGADLANWQAHDPAFLATKLEPGKLALYLDCGTEDDFVLNDGAQYLHEVLTARHIDHAFFLGKGRHNFEFWKPRLPESLKFLRDHTAHST